MRLEMLPRKPAFREMCVYDVCIVPFEDKVIVVPS